MRISEVLNVVVFIGIKGDEISQNKTMEFERYNLKNKPTGYRMINTFEVDGGSSDLHINLRQR